MDYLCKGWLIAVTLTIHAGWSGHSAGMSNTGCLVGLGTGPLKCKQTNTQTTQCLGYIALMTAMELFNVLCFVVNQ